MRHGWGVRIDEAYATWADELTRYASALVGPHDAADVVADAFAGLLGVGDERWMSVSEPRPYLFRCVLNSARMRARSSARRTLRERRVAVVVGSGALTSFDDGEQELIDASVLAALDSLSVQQRAVAYFTYWEDLSVLQIAALLDVSPGAVKKQLVRARNRMRKVLT